MPEGGAPFAQTLRGDVLADVTSAVAADNESVEPACGVLVPYPMSAQVRESEPHEWPLLIVLYTTWMVGIIMVIAVVLM